MRNLLLIIIAILFSFSSFSHDGKKPSEPEILDKTFKIKSGLYDSNKKMKTATLRITENGITYKEFSTENGKIEFTLPRNSQFMLEFSSEGHFTKRIAINTRISDKTDKIPMLVLRMTLIEKSTPNLLDTDFELFDFPVAYMAFDSDNRFYYDKNKGYSEIIINSLNEGTKRYYKENGFSFR